MLHGFITFPARNEKRIIEIDLKYSLVSNFTSILVLETWQQHIEHNICSHKSQVKLYNNCVNHQRAHEQEETAVKQAKMTTVLNLCYDYNCLASSATLRRRSFIDYEETYTLHAHESVVTTAAYADEDMYIERPESSDHIVQAARNPEDISATKLTIVVQHWDLDNPYMIKIEQANPSLTPRLASIDIFNQNISISNVSTQEVNDPNKYRYFGLRILTNVLELELESPQLLRTVAYKFVELGLRQL
ncbi:unnamed protein product [Adineta ricciae]|uniref:Uncharacterized protein n=1 Tax=Adineta ricciae TaxID=249248 RepID=A0A815T706_ADIRI|nr:unnamed protein product [Adineta ricciae]